jgi:hypothetical protein
VTPLKLRLRPVNAGELVSAEELEIGRGESRVRSHCRFAPPLILFILGSLRASVPLFLNRHCDRTLGESAMSGYLPCGAPGFSVNDTHVTGNNTGGAAGGVVRGGDVRIFVVKTKAAASVTTVRNAAPPPLPAGVGLPVRAAISLRRELIRIPSFLQHFDAVVDSDWLGCSSVGTRARPSLVTRFSSGW